MRYWFNARLMLNGAPVGEVIDCEFSDPLESEPVTLLPEFLVTECSFSTTIKPSDIDLPGAFVKLFWPDCYRGYGFERETFSGGVNLSAIERNRVRLASMFDSGRSETVLAQGAVIAEANQEISKLLLGSSDMEES